MANETERVDLPVQVIYQGVFYGPGEVDLPVESAASLRERGILETPKAKATPKKKDGDPE